MLKQPNYEDQILNFELDSAAYTGHLAKGRELSEAAIAAAEHADEKELAAGYAAESALRDALAGNAQIAKFQARRALSMSDASQAEAVAAITLALAGEAAQAERVAAELNKRFPQDTAVQFNYLPVIHAAAALPKDAAKALHAIAPGQRYELAGWATTWISTVILSISEQKRCSQTTRPLPRLPSFRRSSIIQAWC